MVFFYTDISNFFLYTLNGIQMAQRQELKGKRKGMGRERILAGCDLRGGSLSLLPGRRRERHEWGR